MKFLTKSSEQEGKAWVLGYWHGKIFFNFGVDSSTSKKIVSYFAVVVFSFLMRFEAWLKDLEILHLKGVKMKEVLSLL